MRIANEVDRVLDTILPIDTGNEADNDQISSNIMLGLSGFIAQQTVRMVEHGTPIFGKDTLIMSIVGVTLASAGVRFRGRSHEI